MPFETKCRVRVEKSIDTRTMKERDIIFFLYAKLLCHGPSFSEIPWDSPFGVRTVRSRGTVRSAEFADQKTFWPLWPPTNSPHFSVRWRVSLSPAAVGFLVPIASSGFFSPVIPFAQPSDPHLVRLMFVQCSKWVESHPSRTSHLQWPT
jgi:hypothetical protein